MCTLWKWQLYVVLGIMCSAGQSWKSLYLKCLICEVKLLLRSFAYYDSEKQGLLHQVICRRWQQCAALSSRKYLTANEVVGKDQLAHSTASSCLQLVATKIANTVSSTTVTARQTLMNRKNMDEYYGAHHKGVPAPATVLRSNSTCHIDA
jgi:hypothetical protein